MSRLAFTNTDQEQPKHAIKMEIDSKIRVLVLRQCWLVFLYTNYAGIQKRSASDLKLPFVKKTCGETHVFAIVLKFVSCLKI